MLLHRDFISFNKFNNLKFICSKGNKIINLLTINQKGTSKKLLLKNKIMWFEACPHNLQNYVSVHEINL
jgi:hypothetical protein